MERIGIYGGTFNPPHIGHLHAACHAVQQLQLDRLLVIPACIPLHKTKDDTGVRPQQRLEMLCLSMTGQPKICVSDLELQRGGHSYTYETVAQIKKEHPDAQLVLFMGTDMFLSVHTWQHADQIMKDAALGVFYRGQKDEVESVAQQKAFLQQQGATVYLVENPITQISSADLRRMLVFDCGDAYLTPAVLAYIHQNGLYDTNRDLRGLSLDALEQTVVKLLKPNRVKHVLGCRQTAKALAEVWGADVEDAQRAALLHDVTKALDGPLQLTLCNAYGMMLDDFSIQNTKTLHALTGSLVAERIFGENAAVVNAIRSHTTGKANMNMLEKIVYVADYMEPNRDFPGVEQLRQLAYSDMDQALKTGLEMTLHMLQQQKREISPETQEALAWLTEKER